MKMEFMASVSKGPPGLKPFGVFLTFPKVPLCSVLTSAGIITPALI